MTARCLSGDGCRWELYATRDVDAGGVAIIEHSAETGRATFTRAMEDMACAVLTNRQEKDRLWSPWGGIWSWGVCAGAGHGGLRGGDDRGAGGVDGDPRRGGGSR